MDFGVAGGRGDLPSFDDTGRIEVRNDGVVGAGDSPVSRSRTDMASAPSYASELKDSSDPELLLDALFTLMVAK